MTVSLIKGETVYSYYKVRDPEFQTQETQDRKQIRSRCVFGLSVDGILLGVPKRVEVLPKKKECAHEPHYTISLSYMKSQ